MEVILNKSYGGFRVSEEGYDLYCKKMGVPVFRYGHDYNKCSEERVNNSCKSL